MGKKAVVEKVVNRKGKKNFGYDTVLKDVAGIIEEARRTAVRTVNAAMTASYWLIGRRIVEFEQGGKERAEYGEGLLKRLSADLTCEYGRGFGPVNISQMKKFYLLWPSEQIFQTVSEKSLAATSKTPGIWQTLSAKFPLPWSAYVRVLSVENPNARRFYEAEALRGGWPVRQLSRQVDSQFYERTALSRNKAAMLKRGQNARPEDAVTPEEAMKDPYVLEFLNLKDEYSETEVEDALIRHLQLFLLELGDDFCFVGRQKRLRIGDQWFRVDLLFFHRTLRCMVIIDLKIGKFTPADAGQMHMYLNYARAHWVREGENPPVGVILCAQKNEAVARYALEGLPNKVMAAQYRTALPDEKDLVEEMQRTTKAIEMRSSRGQSR